MLLGTFLLRNTVRGGIHTFALAVVLNGKRKSHLHYPFVFFPSALSYFSTFVPTDIVKHITQNF